MATFKKYLLKSLFSTNLLILLITIFGTFLVINYSELWFVSIVPIALGLWSKKYKILMLSVVVGILLLTIFVNPLNINNDGEAQNICGLVKNIDENRIELSGARINYQQSTRSVFIKTKPGITDGLKRYNVVCVQTAKSVQKFQRYAAVYDLSTDDLVYEISNYLISDNMDMISKYINTCLDKNLGPDGGLIKALVFGIKDDLESSDKKDFQDIGASHLLVASGANIVIILSVIKILSRRINRHIKSRSLTLLIELSVITAYLLVVGLEGSLIRAFVFWLISCVQLLLGRKLSFVTQLLYSITVIMLVLPETLFSISLYLSVAALIGINVGDDLIRYLNLKKSNELIKLIVINFCILITTGILTSYFFAQLNFTGLISNLFMLPLAESIVGVGFAICVFIFIANFFNFEFFNKLIEFLANFLSISVNSLRGISNFIQESGLSTALNSKFYINSERLFVLITLILTFWFYLKYMNYYKIRKSAGNNSEI